MHGRLLRPIGMFSVDIAALRIAVVFHIRALAAGDAGIPVPGSCAVGWLNNAKDGGGE